MRCGLAIAQASSCHSGGGIDSASIVQKLVQHRNIGKVSQEAQNPSSRHYILHTTVMSASQASLILQSCSIYSRRELRQAAPHTQYSAKPAASLSARCACERDHKIVLVGGTEPNEENQRRSRFINYRTRHFDGPAVGGARLADVWTRPNQ